MATRKLQKNTKTRESVVKVVWFEIPTDDFERAKTFYGALFGWNFEKLPAAVPDW